MKAQHKSSILLSFSLWLLTGMVIPCMVVAQSAPVVQWQKSFGGTGNDVLTCLKPISGGGYVAAGTSDSGQNGDKSNPSKGDTDFWILKLDSAGNKVWDKTFGGSSSEVLSSFFQTSDGGFILGGYSASDSSGDKSNANKGAFNTADFWIIKIDSGGNKIWDKTIGGNKNDELQVINPTADGGYILGGRSNSDFSGDKNHQAFYGNYDFWLVKLDSLGNVNWDKTFGGNNDEGIMALQQTRDGGYILGGYSTSGMGGNKTSHLYGMHDYWVVKLDLFGNKDWERGFGCGENDFLYSVQQTPDGGFILGGFTELNVFACPRASLSKGIFDYSIMKLDAYGGKVWEKIHGGTDRDFLQSIQMTSDSGFVAAGYSISGTGMDKTEPGRGMEDIWVIKTDAYGVKQWDKTLGGNDMEGNYNYNGYYSLPVLIEPTKDNGYIIGAYSRSGISGDKTSINKGLNDFWIIKLAPVVLGVKDSEMQHVSISPNPTSGVINIQLTERKPAKVLIYNILGQSILSKDYPPSNLESIQLDLSKEPKGIYTVQIISGDQATTRKVILQ